MDLPLLLSAFSSLVTAFVVSAVWATRPAGGSVKNLSVGKRPGQNASPTTSA
jgi:hypothetical protein